MRWPDQSSYSEAVQDPERAFHDDDLRVGKAAINQMGLPRAQSGGFATVFRLDCDHASWAVRCFNREIKDQQIRYEAVSRYLQSLRLPYTVGFKFLDKGISIGGTRYPIVKMEWVDGQPLDEYVSAHLRDPAALLALAEKWFILASDLQSRKIAHGDLQHGNIMVCNGDLRLIDYDAMYVPTLNGKSSNELGLAGYQHPGREQRDFNVYIDNFSAWVILLSLVALASQPELWEQFHQDDVLLFCKKDFDDATNSRLFQSLEASRDKRLRWIPFFLKDLLELPVAQVPPLTHNAFVSKEGDPDVPTVLIRGAGRLSNGTRTVERLAIAVSGLASGAAWALYHNTPPLAFAGAFIAINFCFWIVRFLAHPAHRRKTQLSHELASLDASLVVLRQTIESAATDSVAADRAFRDSESNLARTLEELERAQRHELTTIERDLHESSQRLRLKRDALDQSLQADSQKVNQRSSDRKRAIQEEFLILAGSDPLAKGAPARARRAALEMELVNLRHWESEQASILGAKHRQALKALDLLERNEEAFTKNRRTEAMGKNRESAAKLRRDAAATLHSLREKQTALAQRVVETRIQRIQVSWDRISLSDELAVLEQFRFGRYLRDIFCRECAR